jgi:hypothetical protein
MVADRRTVWGDSALRPMRTDKIVRYGHALVGFSGSSDLVRTRVDWGSVNVTSDPLRDLPPIFRDAPEREYSAIICADDSLWLISGQGGLHALTADLFAIGSGADAALGYLRGLRDGRSEMAISPQDAKCAINYAAETDCSVGDGYQEERL